MNRIGTAMKFFGTLKFKIMLSMLCIALIPLLCLAALQSSQFSSALHKNIQDQGMALAELNQNSLSDWLDNKAAQLSNTLDAHPEFQDMDITYVRSILDHLVVSNPDVELAGAVDRDGGMGVAGINLSQRDYFKAVVETKQFAVSDIITNMNNGHRQIVVAVPVLDQNNQFNGLIASYVGLDTLSETIGRITLAETGFGFLLSSAGDFIHHPNPEFIGEHYTSIDFNEDTLQVFEEEILAKDTGFITYIDHLGVEKIAAFSTVAKSGWKIVVTAPTSEVYAEVYALTRTSTLLILAAVLLVIVSAFFLAHFLAKPIKQVSEHLNVLANADFTQSVPENLLRRKDEIGVLAHSMDTMRQSIRLVVDEVISEATVVRSNIMTSTHNMSNLSANIEEVSATTEEMSASMEETTASAQQMNATSTEIEQSVISIAVKAQNGAGVAEEIKERAQSLKENAELSQKAAYDIRNDIDSGMRAALEQTKAVEQIHILTESILEITNKTNLLALNAAIEAARAGESGRGFAVVATEIRKLAEDSKSNANQIHEVAQHVVNSVQALRERSEQALTFIDGTVIKDYKEMVGTGEQYYRDSESIQNLVTDFSATSEQLLASIRNLTQAINEVTVANNECARGTENISQMSDDVMQKAVAVNDLMNNSRQSAEKLAQIVSKFTV